jgi:hypothetical protein
MDRRLVATLAFALVLAIVCVIIWLAIVATPGLTSCPAFAGAVDFTLTPSGFLSYAGEPLFTGHQLVLAPGSTGTVTMKMTSGFNITEYLEEVHIAAYPFGPFASGDYVIDVSRAYRTATGWDFYTISPNAIGITVNQTSFVKVDDHNYTAVYTVTAAASSRDGVYMMPMFFNGWCSNYYPTIGTTPYLGTIDGVPQTITLLLPLALVAAFGSAVFIAATWIRKRRRTSSRPNDEMKSHLPT